MKTVKKLFSALIALTIFASAYAQEKAVTPEEAAMARYAAPGDMHANLAKSNGMWTEDITMWMSPEGPEMKSKATVMNKMIMGGRYQQGMHRGSFDNKPFEGMSLVGYDNAKGKFVTTWIDNMGTGIMYMEGTWNEKDNLIEFTGTILDPISNKELPIREVFKFVDENTQTMEMFMTTAEGREYKGMNIQFTRRAMQEGKGEMAPEKDEAAPGKPAQPKMQAAPKKTPKK